MPVAKKSQTKYRLVFDTEFQPQWETFVLECRKRGLTPDRQIQTLVAGFNRSGESDSSPAKPAPTKASLMASPLASAHDVDSEPEGTSSKPPAKPPAQPTRQTEAKGPRNYATVFDRGTTIQMGSETLGDVMLLEDTDPDGDIAWLVHIWWYGKGPGTYRFIGGTGKWAGIIGQGKTLGSLRRRSDDHHMLRSEMHWRIERGD